MEEAFLVAQMVKNLPTTQETQVWSLAWEEPLEKETTTHSSIIAWEIPWTEEPGRLQSMGLKKSWTQLSDWHLGLPRWLSGKDSACHWRRFRRCGFNPWVRKIPWRRKWHPLPVLLPGKFYGQRSLVGYSPCGCKESDRTEPEHE